MARKGERQAMVCVECLCASCWHGKFMCQSSRTAGTVLKPVSELRKLRLEHPSNFSAKKIREVHGEDFPRVGEPA